MTDLGKLVPVDIREVWPNEARHFTPWLADNLEALGEVLGIELQLEEVEAQVGGYSLDVLARDLGTGRPVVIENQFGGTNHDHLGKLLTYAGGLDAGAVVWIGESFREEHRQALDWLNRRTDSDTHFFALAVQVLRIDDSRPAFILKPVVLPNEWQRVRPPNGESSKSRRYREYFQELIDTLRERHRFTKAKAAQPQNWYSFASGISGIQYSASFAAGGRVRSELYIGRPDASQNQEVFQALFAERERLEKQLGVELTWEPLEDRQACRVALYREGSIDDSPEAVRDTLVWHVEWLLRFKQAFGPMLTRFKGS